MDVTLKNKPDSNEMELKDYKCTRFHVEMVKRNENCDELNHLCEQENVNRQEVGSIKNMRYFTREALPRLDNYRHIMSIQAAYRPTLDDLHNALTTKQRSSYAGENGDGYDYGYNSQQSTTGEYGWIRGVFIPNILSMCSAMLFLRFAWIVVLTGLVEGLLLIMFGAIVNTATVLSISAISTNGIVKEGGSYAMMSRSLGPEFGIPVGIILLLSNIGLSVVYITGLVEYITNISEFCIFDCSVQDTRSFSLIIFLLFIVIIAFFLYFDITYVPFKVQFILFAVVIVALVDVFLSVSIGPVQNAHQNSFSMFNGSVLEENFFAKYPDEKNVQYSLFFGLFAIFYPAISEFLNGVTMSGRLKDPLKVIPKGTLLSVLCSVFVYMSIVLLTSGTVLYNGNMALTLNNNSHTPIDNSCQVNRCKSKPYDFYLIELLSQEKNLVRIATVLATVYCIFTNCITAISSFKLLCTDALYPKLLWFKAKPAAINSAQAYIFTIIIAIFFIFPGEMNTICPLVSILTLSAYAVINFSTFHISLIRPIGWRPTFKAYNMWLSLAASVLCISIMFLINWIFALVTVIVILAIYLAVSYQKPEVNWGSSTQAQTYQSALLGIYSLNHVEDHVKNYHPQVLILTGLPSHRPPLVSFAHLITKNTSLLICAHIHKTTVSYKTRQEYSIKAQNWLDFHRIKAFYAQVDNVTFEEGAKCLMQASGLGKLKPNILLIGYKNNWLTSTKSDVNMYFNIIHKALDSYLALCILRVKDGLDFSSLFVDHDQLGETVSRMDLGANVLQGSKTAGTGNVENDDKNESTVYSFEDVSVNEIYRTKEGLELPGDTMARVTQFQGKQSKGTIDVWWLYDDGGLTLLIPYLISIRRNWSSCKLRVFALASNYDPLEFEQRNMASLLAKFRIDYSDLMVFSDLMRKPHEETVAFYDALIKDFVTATADQDVASEKITISQVDLNTMQEKTNRHLRLRELLLEHSQDARLVVMTLPIPRKSVVSAGLYMSWLEALTQGMPPFLLVRGNQTSVLTFYS